MDQAAFVRRGQRAGHRGGRGHQLAGVEDPAHQQELFQAAALEVVEDEDQLVVVRDQLPDPAYVRVVQGTQSLDQTACLVEGAGIARTEAVERHLDAGGDISGQPGLAGGSGTQQSLDLVSVNLEVAPHRTSLPDLRFAARCLRTPVPMPVTRHR